SCRRTGMKIGDYQKRREARALQNAATLARAYFEFRQVLECVRFAPLFLLAVALVFTTKAADSTAEFDAANRLYEKGDYGGAVAAYEKLSKSGSASPALLFNLGNAYFKNGQTGRAIASYRQAEKIDPRDPDIRANLKFVLGSVPGNNARVSPIDRALDLLTLNERGFWTAIAVWIWFGCLA